jgi:hypothetical protein
VLAALGGTPLGLRLDLFVRGRREAVYSIGVSHWSLLLLVVRPYAILLIHSYDTAESAERQGIQRVPLPGACRSWWCDLGRPTSSSRTIPQRDKAFNARLSLVLVALGGATLGLRLDPLIQYRRDDHSAKGIMAQAVGEMQ